VRYPFLDPDVADFCLRLPPRLKLLGLRDKAVLRRFAARTLPPAIWRRPKQPYRAPATAGLFGARNANWVEDLLSEDALGTWGLTDVGAASALVKKARARRGQLASAREDMALVGVLTLQSLAHDYLGSFAARARERRDALERLPFHAPVPPADTQSKPSCDGTTVMQEAK
jgi:asparagine synthase (glutamine-hydrolysing)